MIRPLLFALTTCLGASALAVEWPSKVLPPAERGEQLFTRLCVSCHGPLAAGDGKAARSLLVKVPDFSQGFGDRDREELVRAVLKGKGAMPSFEQALRDVKAYTGDTQGAAKAVVDHMDRVGRSLPPAREPPKPPVEEAPDEAP